LRAAIAFNNGVVGQSIGVNPGEENNITVETSESGC
jgi:hypothetical protein